MPKNILLIASLVFFVAVNCKNQQEIPTTRIRQLRPNEVLGYHKPIDMTIAWYPYENKTIEQTGKNEWKVVELDTPATGHVPVILIRYPETGDSIWLDMSTNSRTLGRLLKHSLMTQEPIRRPFKEFFETASCTKCHPSDIKVDFNN